MNIKKIMELNLKSCGHTGIYILKGTNQRIFKLPKNHDSIIANEYNELQKSQNGGVAV